MQHSDAIRAARAAERARIENLLPTEKPGLSVREVYARFALWSEYFVNHNLRELERAGRVASELAPLPCPRGFCTHRRQFWRVA